ncbi:MAG: CoA-binding protein [bacterium]
MEEEICEVPLHHVKDEIIEKVLKESKTIAVFGLSTSPEKDSHKVAAFLQKKGYRVIPVHPKAGEILGERAYASLRDIPEKIDVVNIFRPPSEVMGIVDEALDIGAKAVWAQEGIVNNAAAEKAMANGMISIMGKCMMKEYVAHFEREK